jgi:hypothetical protein
LEATTLSRCDWALMPLPETPKIENIDMAKLLIAPGWP